MPRTRTITTDGPHGSVHAFVHGEADEIRAIRKHLLTEVGLPRTEMSCSPYWRRTMTDEAWRAGAPHIGQASSVISRLILAAT